MHNREPLAHRKMLLVSENGLAPTSIIHGIPVDGSTQVIRPFIRAVHRGSQNIGYWRKFSWWLLLEGS